MHYAHVKRKENHMNRYIMEEYFNDPAIGRRLYEQAHRDRALVIAQAFAWLLSTIRSLATQAAAHLRPGRPARWIARLG